MNSNPLQINWFPILEIKHDRLEKFIKLIPEPIIIDFWAPWCSPCRQLNPLLFAIAEEFQGKVKILKVNIEENQKTAKAYNIVSIPTLIILDPQGKEIGKPIIGFSSNLEQDVLSRLEEYLI